MFLNIAYINRVNIASLNGSEGTGGNLTAMKKISNYNGDEFAYISGQALRRYIKETLMQLDCKIASIGESGESLVFLNNKKIDFKKFPSNDKITKDINEAIFVNTDLDLFGFMIPIKGGQAYRRWSPIKVTPMISILPYKGEYDYLTRKAKKISENKIVQIEIDTLNFMRGNIIVNLKHIGSIVDEYNYDITPILSEEERRKRVNVFIDSIKYLNGGAKQSRNLEDISPKFVIAIKQKTGNPFLLNALSVDKEGNIDIDIIKDAISNSGIDESSISIGIAKGIFANEQLIRDSFSNVTSVSNALESLKENESN